LRFVLRQARPLARTAGLQVAYTSRYRVPSSFHVRLNSSYKPAVATEFNPPKVLYEEIKKRTQQPPKDAYLIDVREPDEIAQGSIPSAVSLPLSDMEHSLTLKEDEFLARFGYPKPKVEQEIIFYCRSGKRSATACEVAMRRGFSNVNNYEGSWLDWVEKESRQTPSS